MLNRELSGFLNVIEKKKVHRDTNPGHLPLHTIHAIYATQIMAHLPKDLLLIAIYNIWHVFCNNSMPIKPQKILTREVTVLDSRNNRARGRLTGRYNTCIPEEGLFCKLKYRANITQDLSLFSSFPSKFLSLFAVPNLPSSGIHGEAFKTQASFFMSARRLKTSQGAG